jgi:hypothetical protein
LTRKGEQTPAEFEVDEERDRDFLGEFEERMAALRDTADPDPPPIPALVSTKDPPIRVAPVREVKPLELTPELKAHVAAIIPPTPASGGPQPPNPLLNAAAQCIIRDSKELGGEMRKRIRAVLESGRDIGRTFRPRTDEPGDVDNPVGEVLRAKKETLQGVNSEMDKILMLLENRKTMEHLKEALDVRRATEQQKTLERQVKLNAGGRGL